MYYINIKYKVLGVCMCMLCDNDQYVYIYIDS